MQKKREGQPSESMALGALLTLAGGFQDAYSYNGRGHVFANAQTGNVVLLGQNLAMGHWQEALRYLLPLLAFLAGVFAAVGLVPDNQVFSPPLELDGAGYIVAGEDTCTNVPGVFAAGDTRVKDLRQLVTAAADGASAAAQAGRYLQSAQ